MSNEYSGLCHKCNEVNTTSKTKDETEFLCVSCHNKEYYDNISKGIIIEMSFDLRDFKEGFTNRLEEFLRIEHL